jgi:hypothetical protein
MIASIIILSILLVASTYANWNLLKKIETTSEANDEAFEWITSVRNTLVQILNNIKKIDKREMFEKDDDAGTTIKRIKDEINKLESAFGNKQN